MIQHRRLIYINIIFIEAIVENIVNYQNTMRKPNAIPEQLTVRVGGRSRRYIQ